jgi:outer membrane biosynthesis protein TonB
MLVDAALEAVREAAPFPAFPSALERQRETFELPIVFKLE